MAADPIVKDGPGRRSFPPDDNFRLMIHLTRVGRLAIILNVDEETSLSSRGLCRRRSSTALPREGLAMLHYIYRHAATGSKRIRTRRQQRISGKWGNSRRTFSSGSNTVSVIIVDDTGHVGMRSCAVRN